MEKHCKIKIKRRPGRAKLVATVLATCLFVSGCGANQDTTLQEESIKPTAAEKVTEPTEPTAAEKVTEPTPSDPTEGTTATEAPTLPEPTEAPAPEKRLSETCDELLASGYNSNGDFYEIVSNQHEDYTGLIFEVGVIKNNEWLLEPTSDMPFVTKENMFQDKTPETGSVSYLGQGCFVSQKKNESEYDLYSRAYIYIFYNVETGKSYSTADYDWSKKDYIPSLIQSDTDNQLIINSEVDVGYYNEDDMDSKYVRTDFTTLDKRDMSLDTISVYHDYSQATMVGNISSGLFAVKFSDLSQRPYYYFYDADGNMVIDLSEYKIESQTLFFSNGECKVDIINNNGTAYTITIDKKGNVIDSELKTD